MLESRTRSRATLRTLALAVALSLATAACDDDDTGQGLDLAPFGGIDDSDDDATDTAPPDVPDDTADPTDADTTTDTADSSDPMDTVVETDVTDTADTTDTTDTAEPTDTADTADVSAFCGDNVLDAGELCDGTELGGSDCASLGQGFDGGTLACAADCTFDTSACTRGCDPATQLECADGTCIDTALACDGNADCADGSDEAPANPGCPVPELCDNGVDDDGDGAVDCDDTADCASHPDCASLCQPDQFECADGTCIDGVLACNGFANCPGGEDDFPSNPSCSCLGDGRQAFNPASCCNGDGDANQVCGVQGGSIMCSGPVGPCAFDMQCCSIGGRCLSTSGHCCIDDGFDFASEGAPAVICCNGDPDSNGICGNQAS